MVLPSVLQPAFSEEENASNSLRVSRSSSSSSMSSPYTVDSSPPSSPSLLPFDEPMDDGDDDSMQKTPGSSQEGARKANRTVKWHLELPGDALEHGTRSSNQHSPVHPYSGSTLSTKSGAMYTSPTLYEKGGERAKFKRHNPRLSLDERDAKDFISRSQLSAFDFGNQGRKDDDYLKDDLAEGGKLDDDAPRDAEDAIWENAISQIIDVAGHTLDLSSANLTCIPPRIVDLENLVVLQGGASASGRGALSRTNSAMTRTLSRSTTSSFFSAGSLGAQAREIHVFLMNNLITTLPIELFRLDTLVTLSLRANRLTELPPLISHLRSLRELNVANNQLPFLPCEILDLNLSSLSVEMNPFIMPTNSSLPNLLRFGPITRHHNIMPLTELALRVLLQPIGRNMAWDPMRSRSESVLEAFYDTPLESGVLPPNVKAILSACVPGSIAAPLSTANASYSPPAAVRASSAYVHSHPPLPSSFPCISKCPSPNHRFVDNNVPQYRIPVFVDHAEERLSWEKDIAGCKAGGEYGVPVLWRGCSAGCLDGLSDDQDSLALDSKPDGNGNDEDWDMDADVDVPVVQHVVDSDGEGLLEVTQAQLVADGQSAPFTSDGFEFDD